MAAALLCLAAGLDLIPLPLHDERTDAAFLAWRERPTADRQSAWVAAEAAAARHERAVQQGLVQAAAGLALFAGGLWWLGERRAARAR
jgi:hypothetical protein